MNIISQIQAEFKKHCVIKFISLGEETLTVSAL